MMLPHDFLNRIVSVKIDRPPGSRHPGTVSSIQ
jgi:hypothetical protein